MKNFGDWFADFSTQDAPEPEVPEGIDECGGVYFATCSMCEKFEALWVDIKEIPQTGYIHYCGGSPRCCP